MNQKVSKTLKISLSIVLLLFLIFKIGPKELLDSIIVIPPIIILLFSLNYIISIIFGTTNIKILADTIKKISFKNMLKYYFISWSIGMVSPGKMGEFSILFFLKKNEDIGYGKSLAVSLMDKLMTVITLIIVSSFAIPMIFPDTNLFIIILLLIFFIFSLMFVLNSKKIRELIKKYVLNKYSVKFEKFHLTFKSIIKLHKLRIILNFLITLIKWFSTAFFTYLALIIMGQHITLFTVFVIACITMLVSAIPISLSGLGVKEITFVGLMAKYGISGEIALSLSVLSLAIAYVIAAVANITIRTTKKEK